MADWQTSEVDEPEPPYRLHHSNASRRSSIPKLDANARNGASSDVSPETVSYLKRKVEYLESRIAALESSYRPTTAAVAPTIHGHGHSQDDEGRHAGRFFKGKGFKTSFFGATNALSMLVYVMGSTPSWT